MDVWTGFTVTGFSVTTRRAKRGGKLVYRIKRIGKKECAWTDNKERITVLAEGLKFDTL